MVTGTPTYRRLHRNVASIFPIAEYLDIKRIAESRGLTITGFATQAVRDAIATAKEAEALIPSLVPADNSPATSIGGKHVELGN